MYCSLLYGKPDILLPESSLCQTIRYDGPYNMDMCKQMVTNRQLTPQSMVWMEGMPSWTPAGNVPVLQPLFAPPAASGMPPIPPVGGSVPPYDVK